MRFLIIVLNNSGIGRGLIKPIMELPYMQARNVTSREPRATLPRSVFKPLMIEYVSRSIG